MSELQFQKCYLQFYLINFFNFIENLVNILDFNQNMVNLLNLIYQTKACVNNLDLALGSFLLFHPLNNFIVDPTCP